ncbi:ArsR/SmtB family transcription factor [Georgenia sp. Z1344]|uniref:ArsR/SmtB family transcription factor n=1 Tax=Georgenia sp. Z1344 TaxID=3416706 RepID=UPI003CFA31CD
MNQSTEQAPRGQTPAPAPAPSSPVQAVLGREQAEATASMLRVVSDPSRLQLLSLIQNAPNGHARITDLTVALGLRQPTVTYHVKVLVEAGVVRREARGREVLLSIVPDRLTTISDLLR